MPSTYVSTRGQHNWWEVAELLSLFLVMVRCNLMIVILVINSNYVNVTNNFNF